MIAINSRNEVRAHLATIGCNGQEISQAHLAAIGCNGLLILLHALIDRNSDSNSVMLTIAHVHDHVQGVD